MKMVRIAGRRVEFSQNSDGSLNIIAAPPHLFADITALDPELLNLTK